MTGHLYAANYKETRTAAVYNYSISISSRQRGAVSGNPLPERMDFGPAVAARQTHL